MVGEEAGLKKTVGEAGLEKLDGGRKWLDGESGWRSWVGEAD